MPFSSYFIPLQLTGPLFTFPYLSALYENVSDTWIMQQTFCLCWKNCLLTMLSSCSPSPSVIMLTKRSPVDLFRKSGLDDHATTYPSRCERDSLFIISISLEMFSEHWNELVMGWIPSVPFSFVHYYYVCACFSMHICASICAYMHVFIFLRLYTLLPYRPNISVGSCKLWRSVFPFLVSTLF